MVSNGIRHMMELRNMNGNDMATALDCTSQNIYQTLSRDNWNLRQLEKFAAALDCDVEIVLKDRHTDAKISCAVNK